MAKLNHIRGSQNEIFTAIASAAVAIWNANKTQGWFGKAKQDKLVQEFIQTLIKDKQLCSDVVPSHKRPILDNIEQLTVDEFYKLGDCLKAKKNSWSKFIADKKYNNRRHKKQIERWVKAMQIIIEGWVETKKEVDKATAQQRKALEEAKKKKALDDYKKNTTGAQQAGFSFDAKNPFLWLLGIGIAGSAASKIISSKKEKKPAKARSQNGSKGKVVLNV